MANSTLRRHTKPIVPRRQEPSSFIEPDGTYVVGKNGVQKIRFHEAAVQLRPELRDLITNDAASKAFRDNRLLPYDVPLRDGFRARFSEEVLLVDRREDPILRKALEKIKGMLDEARTRPLSDKVLLVSVAVDELLGGRSDRDPALDFAKTLAGVGVNYPDDLHFGKYFGGVIIDSDKRGAGMCRHRAILFKYILDVLDLAPCAVVDGVAPKVGVREIGKLRTNGQRFDHMWNVVLVDGQPRIVDIMGLPGCFLEEDFLAKEGLELHRVGGRSGKSIPFNLICEQVGSQQQKKQQTDKNSRTSKRVLSMFCSEEGD